MHQITHQLRNPGWCASLILSEVVGPAGHDDVRGPVFGAWLLGPIAVVLAIPLTIVVKDLLMYIDLGPGLHPMDTRASAMLE